MDATEEKVAADSEPVVEAAPEDTTEQVQGDGSGDAKEEIEQDATDEKASESLDIVAEGEITVPEAEETEAGGGVEGEAAEDEVSKDVVETVASEEISEEQTGDGQEEGGAAEQEDKAEAEGEEEAGDGETAETDGDEVNVLPHPEGSVEETPSTGPKSNEGAPPPMDPISEEGEGAQGEGPGAGAAVSDEVFDKSMPDSSDPEVQAMPPERLNTVSPTDFIREEDKERSDSQDLKEAEENDFVEEEISAMEKVPDRESLIEFYQQAMKDRESLLQSNTTLQNKLSEYFRRKKTEEGGPVVAGGRSEQVDRSVSDLEQRYLSFMTNLEELQNKQRENKQSYETEISAIKAQCSHKEGELDRMAAEFVEKRRLIASKAINSRTGKPLQNDEIEMYILNEQKKDQEVKAVRLENIKLKNRLQKREKQLKQKEELAEGLHLIDFEQLKIENQTYNEKIEERNEELSKLRKKITNTVEVLTHLKEKLQYIQQENGQLNQQLKTLDCQVAQKRDALTKVKQNRDALRNENHELNRKCGLLGNETLLRDYEEKYAESSQLKQRLGQLRNRHTELAMKCTGYKKKIEQARSGIMIN